MIYSASSYTAGVQYGDKLYFVKKQLIGVLLGTAAMVGTCFIPYKKLIKFRYPAIIIAAILLALVFVPVIGITSIERLDKLISFILRRRPGVEKSTQPL